MITRQLKNFYVNSTGTQFSTSTGTKPEKTVLFYKSATLLRFIVRDSTLTPIDLDGCTFTLKIASAYNDSDLITVANGDFVAGDWSGWDPTVGQICCRLNLSAANILAYLGTDASDTANLTLWATSGGLNYCLVTAEITIKSNIY